METQSPTFTDADLEAFRCLAFVDTLPLPLSDAAGLAIGPRLVALTPWRHNLLFLYHSPFVMGTRPTRPALIQALWLLSPDLRLGSRLRFYAFALRWRFLPVDEAIKAISLTIRAQFVDAPPQQVSADAADSDGDAADPRWLADFVLSAMKRIGLAETAVLHTPYSRLLQYMAIIDERATGEKKPRFNRRRDQKAKAYLLAKRARAGLPANTGKASAFNGRKKGLSL